MTFKIAELVTLSHYKTLIICDQFIFENIRTRSCTHYTNFHLGVSDPQILLSCKNEHNRCSIYHVTLWLCDNFVRKQEKKRDERKYGEICGWGDTGRKAVLQKELEVQCEKKQFFFIQCCLTDHLEDKFGFLSDSQQLCVH